MTRPPRDPGPGFFHLGTNAAGPAAYFLDDRDRLMWVRYFVLTLDRHRWTCAAFCLMDTHWHALVEVRDTSLSAGMHALNSRYSRYFNETHGRVGYLVRDRFWARRKTTTEELLEAYRYVVNNPVRADAVPRAEDWFWSSYSTTIGLVNRFPFVDARRVLGSFDSDRRRAIARLRRFVAAGEELRAA